MEDVSADPTKRKRVVFADDTAPSARASFAAAYTGAGHPDSKKAKTKTEAKQRYLKKKAKRHRVLAKARRDSAPKNKQRDVDGDGGADSNEDDDSESNKEDEEDQKDELNAHAGPSRLPDSPEVPQPSPPAAKSLDVEELDEADEAAERQRRKLEKREKRANRDKSEKKEKKEKKKEGKEGHGEDTPFENGETSVAVDAKQDKDPVDDLAAIPEDDRITPPPLEAFPLPIPAPAPDPAILSRQGLPAGLEHATFIDQELKVPISDLEVHYPGHVEKGLGEQMEKRLLDMGIRDLFAVQAAMLPHLMPLRLSPHPFARLDDYLISAPTGSGKTLAYAIPIIHILSSRFITRLRALVVLPTRDLVAQVRETMEGLAKGTGLVIGTATGQHSFSHEQNQLIADQETKMLGGSSKVDILIATPGRLIDHLTKTPNFTLQHLRFLVIDEADRLLNQSFHDWLFQVLSHTCPPTEPVELPKDFTMVPWDHVAKTWQVAYGLCDGPSEYGPPQVLTCQKLLFSATLTRDPAAIASLQLRNPQYYIVQSPSELPDVAGVGESFALPATLQERYLVIPPALKPLNLIHLMHHADYAVRGVLVFAKSVENAGRLVRLLTYFEEAFSNTADRIMAKGYTSDMRPGERKSLLADFLSGKVHMLVCSDLIARGMDLPSVAHVVSYDTPVDMRKYVHRVGRTARAGRQGTAWTLVEKQEALHFKRMLKTAGHDRRVKKIKVKEDDLAPYREAYEVAMGRLKEYYTRHQ